MRRAAQANWSRLPNHNPPRFYTAWVIRVAFVMSAVCPVYPGGLNWSTQHFILEG